MDTVARVAHVAVGGCYQGSLDDKTGFHHILIQPASWPLLGVLPFGSCESPYAYHTLSEAKHLFCGSEESPHSYIGDSWLANFRSTYEQTDRQQWLTAAQAIHTAMLVSFMCGYFLSANKCDLCPTSVQRYRLLCDSDTASRGVQSSTGQLDKLHDILREVLEEGSLDAQTFERIARK